MCLTLPKDETATIKSTPSVNKTRQNATAKKKNGRLKMMEIEQNLRKILAKIHRKKHLEKCYLTTGTGQKNESKNTKLASI